MIEHHLSWLASMVKAVYFHHSTAICIVILQFSRLSPHFLTRTRSKALTVGQPSVAVLRARRETDAHGHPADIHKGHHLKLHVLKLLPALAAKLQMGSGISNLSREIKTIQNRSLVSHVKLRDKENMKEVLDKMTPSSTSSSRSTTHLFSPVKQALRVLTAKKDASP